MRNRNVTKTAEQSVPRLVFQASAIKVTSKLSMISAAGNWEGN